MLCIYDNLAKHFDRGISTQSIYFDISKAFDRVWHRGLLQKLDSIGIRGKLLDFFEDYLTDRSQCVVVKGCKSNIKPVMAGVPQGSVLGPILFLIYINDITENIESIIKLFADDTSLSASIQNPDIRAEILNSDLDKVCQWSKTWKVNFNEAKTELVNTLRGNGPVFDLKFDSHILIEKDSHKHLGVYIQKDCRWGEHIQFIISKTSKLINCLRSLKYMLSRKALETMYASFVLPIFDYADVLWDGCNEYYTNTLETLHLDALRTIIGAVRGTSHHKIYSESGFIPLKERRKRHKLMHFFKIVNGYSPNYLSDLLPPLVSSINPYHRRNPLERRVPAYRTETYRKSFFPSTTHLWNELPTYVKEFQSICQFKNYLRSEDLVIPPYYYLGNRKDQIVHCRLRLNISDLNADLCRRHLRHDSSCSCHFPEENAEHFLLHCTNYTNQRAATLHSLPPQYKTTETLLSGNLALSVEENEIIFLTVQSFIKLSERF